MSDLLGLLSLVSHGLVHFMNLQYPKFYTDMLPRVMCMNFLSCLSRLFLKVKTTAHYSLFLPLFECFNFNLHVFHQFGSLHFGSNLLFQSTHFELEVLNKNIELGIPKTEVHKTS